MVYSSTKHKEEALKLLEFLMDPNSSLPLLQKMLQHENTSASPARHPVRALVLAPTRELADQVTIEVRRLARGKANTKVPAAPLPPALV